MLDFDGEITLAELASLSAKGGWHSIRCEILVHPQASVSRTSDSSIRLLDFFAI